MANARHHARLAAPAEEVWALIRDPGGIAGWLPGVEAVRMDGDDRIVTAMGADIREACDVDDALRRFQYTITDGPLTFDLHRSTIDVLEDGDGCVVVYGIEIQPGDMVAIMDAISASGVAALKERFG
jgi:hypothetical protein